MLVDTRKKLNYINIGLILVTILFIVTIETNQLCQEKFMLSITTMAMIGFFFISFFALFMDYILKKNILHQTKINHIFNNVTAFLVITNGKKLIDVNRSFLDFFHLQSMNEFLKDYSCICDKFLSGEGYLQKKASEKENWLEYLLNNSNATHKVKMLSIDEEVHIFQVNVQEYYEDDEMKYIVSFEDITVLENELKISRKKDKQLLEQSRLAQMGEMISMIAHQWRQPLSAISSASGAINIKAKRDKLSNEMAEELSSKILGYSQHLSTTIDDFKNFFKKNKEMKETSYKEIIEHVLSIVAETLVYHNIEVIKTFEESSSFLSYENEIKQVVLNIIKNAEDTLLENAIKNPSIHIFAYQKDAVEYLEISDNGGGIPKEIIEKIFDPYFSTKKQKDGTGLGLYMSKIIIEEHCQGKLSVFNAEEGALFRIELPKRV